MAQARAARPGTWWETWRPAVVFGVLAAVAHRVITAIVGLQSAWDGTWPEHLRHPGEAFRPFAQWDSGWYLNIAARGYAANQNIPDGSGHLQSGLVFPPVFPGLIRAASDVLGTPHMAALLIVFVALAVGLVGLYRLVELQWDRRVAGWSVVLLLAFPPSFFFGVVYSDAIVFAAVVWAFLFARQRQWWPAGVCIAIAGLTKTVAFVAVIALLVELWGARRRDARRDALSAAGIVVPPLVALCGWMGYQWRAFGDPFRFVAAESQWGRALAPPWRSIANGFNDVVSQHFLQASTPYFLDLLAIPVLLAVIVYGFRRGMPRSWLVYTGLVLIALTCSDTLLSVDRYVLMVFPVFVAAALALREHEWLRPLALVALTLLNVDLLHRFIITGWAG